jgi:hypothetical protein
MLELAKNYIKNINIFFPENKVQSAAHQTIQNCQTTPVDYKACLLLHKAQISFGIFDS